MVEIPDITQFEKEGLLELYLKSPLHTIKHFIENFKVSHRDAKYIIAPY
jgi:hypothetical protein